MLGLLRISFSVALAALLCVPRPALGENFTEGLPPPADTDPQYPPPPPPPPQQDRKSGNGAAIAAAIIGATMAGISCAMLMKQAAAEPDPSQKRMLQAMAMQQCAQAAQNAANAAQNKEGGEKLQQPQEPGTPKFAEMPALAKNKNEEGRPQAAAPGTEPGTTDTPQEQIVGPEFQGPGELAFDPPAPNVGPDGDFSGGFGEIGGGIAKLDPIDRTSIQFDDKAKGGGTTPQTPLGFSSARLGDLPSGGGLDSSKGLGNADIAGEEGEHGGGRRRGGGRKGELTLALGSASGADATSGKSGSDSTFDVQAIMNQLMGKNGAAAAAGGGAPESINLAGNKGSQGQTVNIFQYASFRYRKSRDEGLIIDPRKKKIVPQVTAAGAPKPAPTLTQRLQALAPPARPLVKGKKPTPKPAQNPAPVAAMVKR